MWDHFQWLGGIGVALLVLCVLMSGNLLSCEEDHAHKHAPYTQLLGILAYREHLVGMHLFRKRKVFQSGGRVSAWFSDSQTQIAFFSLHPCFSAYWLWVYAVSMLPTCIRWYKHMWVWFTCTCTLSAMAPWCNTLVIIKKSSIIPSTYTYTIRCILARTYHSLHSSHRRWKRGVSFHGSSCSV